MVIAPEILIPSATAAVGVIVGIVRLLTGAKNATLSQENCRAFLRDNVPDLENCILELSSDHRAVLVRSAKAQPIGLVRSFGDKYVFQPLQPDDFAENNENNTVLIKRSGIALPSLLFTPEAAGRTFV